MNLRTVRACVAALGVAAGFLTVPAESHAIFHWFERWCGTAPAPTYAPAANACDCQPPQVTNYVPQTCYRTQYVTVPVTTYRPVTSYDPCTGCPVTCMRPTTTYVQQARLVPYTTFRMMLANFFGRNPCNTCGTTSTVGYAPSVNYVQSSGCSGCGTSAPAYASTTTTAPYTSGSTIISSPASTIPSLPPGAQPATSPRETLKKPASEEGQDGNLQPIPMNESNESGSASQTGATSVPRLITPGERTTSYPILRAGRYRPVSWDAPATAPEQPKAQEKPAPATRTRPIDDGGWRPSKR